MSAAVAQRNSPHNIGGIKGHTTTSSSTTTTSTSTPASSSKTTMDSKRIKNEDKSRKASPVKDTRTTKTTSSSSSSSSSPKQESATIESKSESKAIKTDASETAASTTTAATGATAAPLAPPPRPNHLSSEPNPFEQSFGNPSTETPGKGINLPSVASLTSPAPLGTGASLTGGFGDWGSLRSGPLSPAMLSGPQGGDYFNSIRSFPTPNESSLRTGLTPGGGGSMFPAPSPGTQALFGYGGTTPAAATVDFLRSAQSTAVQPKQLEPPVTSAPQAQKPASTIAMTSALAQHPDNEAANGLFMLAQASAPQVNGSYSNGASRHQTNGSISATSNMGKEEDSDDNKNGTRKSKRASAGKTSRRKTEDTPAKQPATKRGKSNSGIVMEKSPDQEDEMDSDMDMDMDMPAGKDTRKMTDEEKRKNFLERNRVAALKCRQRKKQWLQNLQNKVELYSSENDALTAQVTSLRDEVLNLKTILIAHKDCPIAQNQSQTGAYLQHGSVDYGNGHYSNGGYSMGMQMQGPRRAS